MSMSFIQEAHAEDQAIGSKDEAIRQLEIQVTKLQQSLNEVPKDALSVQNCMDMLGVSRFTWYKMRKEGKTPKTFTIPGVKRQFVLKTEYDKWLKELSKHGINTDYGSNRIQFNQ